MDAPADAAYAVLPVGVDIISPDTRIMPHSHSARARAWTHAEQRARTYDHARGSTFAYVIVRT